MLVGLSKCLKQIIWIELNRVKNPNWLEANQLAIYKHGQGFDFATTVNKSSWRSGQDLNLWPPDCKSGALTTWPRCLLANPIFYNNQDLFPFSRGPHMNGTYQKASWRQNGCISIFTFPLLWWWCFMNWTGMILSGKKNKLNVRQNWKKSGTVFFCCIYRLYFRQVLKWDT